MVSLQAIREITCEATKRAAESEQTPLAVWPGDDENELYCAPFLGDYVAHGYRRFNLENYRGMHGVYMGDNFGFGALFVDSSGWGRPGEPALTMNEFTEMIHHICADHDYGICIGVVEAGPFQVKIGLFTKTK